MPYPGETASKVAHVDVVSNPDVQAFLAGCEYLTPPSEEEGKSIGGLFKSVPTAANASLPAYVIAVDGSLHETSLDDRFPSTKVGYVKVSAVLIDMQQMSELRVDNGRFVDPFRVAELDRTSTGLGCCLPSANVRRRGYSSVRDSFRAALDDYLLGTTTRFVPSSHKSSLRTTLFHLASLRPDAIRNDPDRLTLHRCPSCRERNIEVADVPELQHCPHCSQPVYPSDVLRIWEEVEDYQSNLMALNRVMMLLEHMLPIHYIRYLAESSLRSLGRLCFFVDGPLAVFGTAAWIHGAIMRYLYEINTRLARVGLAPVLLIGLQKTGQVVDHLALIDRFVECNRVSLVTDEYRYRYILAGRDPAGNGFGFETYYGQDFLLKTSTGRSFVFSIQHPFASKGPQAEFNAARQNPSSFTELGRAVRLIEHFESDLYENAVVPIALAHRHAAISLRPGSQVLDLLARRSLSDSSGYRDAV